MDMLSKVITLIGLCLDVVGVIFLAYDLFWKQAILCKSEMLMTQLKNELLLHESILSDYEKLSQFIGETRATPHINREYDRHTTVKGKLESSLKDIKPSYEKQATLWGFRGLWLVVIGFVLQAVGTIIG